MCFFNNCYIPPKFLHLFLLSWGHLLVFIPHNILCTTFCWFIKFSDNILSQQWKISDRTRKKDRNFRGSMRARQEVTNVAQFSPPENVVVCISCSALMFPWETSKANGDHNSFSACCNDGIIQRQLFKDPPPKLRVSLWQKLSYIQTGLCYTIDWCLRPLKMSMPTSMEFKGTALNVCI